MNSVTDDTLRFRLSSSSRTHHHSGSDHCFDFDDIEEDEVDLKTEFPCPFCSEDFDFVGLCCHIDDEHPDEAESELCPFCALIVGTDMVGHITSHHGDIFRLQQKLKLLKDARSALSLSRKEFLDGHLQSFLGGSSRVVSSTNMEPDPLLSSFIYDLSISDVSESVQAVSSTKLTSAEKSSDENMLVRELKPSSFSEEDPGEKSRRCDFVQGLLCSAIFDDYL